MFTDFTNWTQENLQPDHLGRLRLGDVGPDEIHPDEIHPDNIRVGTLLSTIHDIGLAGRVPVSWIDQWTVPQRWHKHEDNPIYGPTLSGAWDSWTNGVSIIPNPNGKSYQMFYAGDEGEGIGVADADIDNPTVWTERPGCPILKPRSDNWEGNKINQPRVVVVTHDHWRMYYTGWGFPGRGTNWAMGLAESFDGGVTWKRTSEEPILDRGDDGSPDGAGVCVPTLLRVADRWMMWYTAGVIKPSGTLNIHLCLALSDDGLHWQKYQDNPVLGDDFSLHPQRNVTSRCCVRHDHGVFRMWYSYANPDYRIRYAESLDGIAWERAVVSPTLGPSPAPAWDDQRVEYPEVQIVDGEYRMWFCGNTFGSVGYAIGIEEMGTDVAIRSGNSEEPDDTWTEWIAVNRQQAVTTSRFVQVKAQLWSKHPQLSPCLNKIVIENQGKPIG